ARLRHGHPPVPPGGRRPVARPAQQVPASGTGDDLVPPLAGNGLPGSGARLGPLPGTQGVRQKRPLLRRASLPARRAVLRPAPAVTGPRLRARFGIRTPPPRPGRPARRTTVLLRV